MAPWRQALASSAEPRAIAPASTQGSGANVHSALAVLNQDAAPGAATSQGATGTMASSGGMAAAPKRKQVSVTEMLEYVKGLDIDPIKEADMLWIAEEAFNAALPPGWSEHQDDQGRVYFHNGSTGESTWRHPMDDLFREIVDYQRRVVKAGGFWQVEDEIAELEENIRLNLADWMELYDEHGEKFFYNRKNDESRFDDPRMAVYHSLYARIKLVAKMKERLPILARAPRPEEPTEQDVEIQKRMEEEEKRYLAYLIKLQSFARVILAKRKKRLMQALRTVQKGPQPLRGKLRLRMEKLGPGGGKELVLSQTTGHRKARAATKIQARVRGMLARRRFRPLVMHRTYLSKVATKIQATARVWLAKRRCARLREERLINAAVNIQRVYRGYRDRQYVSALRAEKLRYEWMMKCVVLIQSGIRMHLAYKECKRRRYQRFATCIKLIKRQTKVFLVRDQLNRDKLKLRPIQAALSFNPDPQSQSIVPWSWKIWTTPPVFSLEPTKLVADAPLSYINIFSESGPEYYKDMAATRIQSRVRTMLAKERLKVLKEVADDFWMEVFVKLQVELEERREAAIQVQKVFRGKHIRGRDVLAERKEEQLMSREPQIKMAQAYIKRFFAQEWLQAALVQYRLVENSTKIQAAWRGWLARRHVERLYEEALWPMKGWFEYTATGREIVHLEVRFLPNPGFDDYRYFVKHGSYDELELDMVDVDDVIARVLRKHPEEETPTPSKATPDGSLAQSRPGSAPRSRRTSKAESVVSRAPSVGSRAPSRARSSVSEDAAGRLQSRVGSARPQHEQRLEEVAEDDGRAVSKASVVSRPSRGPKNLPLPPSHTDGEAGSAAGPASRKSSREPAAQVAKLLATEEVQPPPVPEPSTMPKLSEEPEEEATVLAPDTASPEATPAAGPAKQKPATSASPAAKSVRRPGRGARSTSASKASSKAAPAPAEAEHSAAGGSDSATEAADFGHVEGSAPAEPQSAVEVTLLADEDRPLERQPTLEYSVASDGEPDDPSREREQSAQESPQEPQSQLLKRQPRQFGKVAKPRKKSPPAQPREREPIAGASHMSLAQTFLVEAPRQYADAKPPRAKEDEPRPPKAKPPSEPPAPSPPGSTRDLSASSSAAALRGTQARLGEADAAAPAVPVKRKTYGGTLEGGKFVRTQAESVDELSADVKKEILEDLLAAKKKKEQELLEKQKLHRARRKQEVASKAARPQPCPQHRLPQPSDSRGMRASPMTGALSTATVAPPPGLDAMAPAKVQLSSPPLAAPAPAGLGLGKDMATPYCTPGANMSGEWFNAVLSTASHLDKQGLEHALGILDHAIRNVQYAKAMESIIAGSARQANPALPAMSHLVAAELWRSQVCREQQQLLRQLHALRAAAPPPGGRPRAPAPAAPEPWPQAPAPRRRAAAEAPPGRLGRQVQTLSTSLQLLSNEDPECLFIVRRINKLGFKASRKLKQHFAEYGSVLRVLVAHSTVRQHGDPQCYARRRPSSLGFVHMASAEAVRCVLEAGEEQEVDGSLIRVQRFERQRGDQLEEEIEEEANALEMEKIDNLDWGRQHTASTTATAASFESSDILLAEQA